MTEDRVIPTQCCSISKGTRTTLFIQLTKGLLPPGGIDQAYVGTFMKYFMLELPCCPRYCTSASPVHDLATYAPCAVAESSPSSSSPTAEATATPASLPWETPTSSAAASAVEAAATAATKAASLTAKAAAAA